MADQSILGAIDEKAPVIQLEPRRIVLAEADETIGEPELAFTLCYLSRAQFGQIASRYPNRQNNVQQRRQFQRDVALACQLTWDGMTPGNTARICEKAFLHFDQFNGANEIPPTKADVIAMAESIDEELFRVSIMSEALNRDAFVRDMLIKKKSTSSSDTASTDLLPSSAPAPTP